MKLKILFYISAALQLSTWAFMLSIDYAENHAVFYAIEALTTANIIFLIYFYRKVHRPIDTLSNGLDLLKGQDWNSRLNKVGQREVDNIAETFNEMLSRLKEQRLRFEERSHFLDILIGHAPIGIIILDFDRRIAVANPASKRFLGCADEDVTGRGLQSFAGLGQNLASIRPGGSEIIRIGSAVTFKCTSLSFVDLGVEHLCYMIEDIGDAMADAERSAYEKIIRIIAHEVNNTVTPIATAIQLTSDMMEGKDSYSEYRELLKSCSERALRMSEFVSRLADVVKIPDPVMSACDIGDVVSRNRPFLESLCNPHGITLVIEQGHKIPPARIDVPLIEQSLVNIVKNSAESIAMTGRKGVITISTEKTPHGGIRLTVADNGIGIDPAKSIKIFTPFFTDKPTGQGVGLTFVREVLRRHKCTYALQTDPADGLTRFTIDFPSEKA